MMKILIIWSLIATLLAGFFIWRYEQKQCEVINITNIVDTAVIYIPVTGNATIGVTGKPGLQLPKLPSIITTGQEKSFVIMPQVTLGLNNKASIGLSAMYIRNRYTYSYTYDFILKSHTIGIGIRF